MKIKFEYFKEFRRFSFKKWYFPIGISHVYIENYKNRIYETCWLLSSPLGCYRITFMPFSN